MQLHTQWTDSFGAAVHLPSHPRSNTRDANLHNSENGLKGQGGGTRSLNINRSYGASAGWTATEGVREFLQNLWDGAVRNAKFGGNFHPNEMRVVESSSRIAKRGDLDAGRMIKFDGYSVTRPSGGTLMDGRLFRIEYNSQRRILKLINYDVALQKDILIIGETSKKADSSSIGGHGEGLKMGQIFLEYLLLLTN